MSDFFVVKDAHNSTSSWEVKRVTKRDIEVLEALVPGTTTIQNIEVVETVEQAIEMAKGMVELLFEEGEYFSLSQNPVVKETELGWHVTFSIFQG